jgi:parallel beta-helix repeat protein
MSNNISDHTDGIFVEASNNTISENNIYGNGKGIVLSGFKVALSNNITRNIIRENGNGIFFDGDCSQNIIEGNEIYDNAEVGVRILTGSHHNLIFNNSFTNNLLSHAYDYGESNRWDNGTIGNHWEDYTGKDADDDGIGDTPYVIPGSAGSQDNFPIWDDGPEPVIPIELIILISVISGGAVIGVATILLIRRKRKRIE